MRHRKANRSAPHDGNTRTDAYRDKIGRVDDEDVKPLLDKGLIRGGSLENAIVVRGESVMGKEPLRYQDEFVRHKILDIVGDLYLAGCRFVGHVIAVKPGHAANVEMTK